VGKARKALDVADGEWEGLRRHQWRLGLSLECPVEVDDAGKGRDSSPEPLSASEVAVGLSFEEGSARCSPGKVSTCWVIKSSKEFYPKIGLSYEGKEDKLMVLLNKLEKSKEQPVADLGGISSSFLASKGCMELKRLDWSL
jgi:hypothetical protein